MSSVQPILKSDFAAGYELPRLYLHMSCSEDASQDRYHRRMCSLRSVLYSLALRISDSIVQAVVAVVQTPEHISLQAVFSCCRSRPALLLPRWACIFREPLSFSKYHCNFIYRTSVSLRGRGFRLGSWRVCVYVVAAPQIISLAALALAA